jgi:hypothetical protein
VTCALGNLADDATATAQIRVSAQAAGPVTNTASVASAQTDPVPGNNSDDASVRIDPLPSQAPGPGTCAGRTVTIPGSGGADRIVGTIGPDVISGLAGKDRITGAGGDDFICGRAGTT